MRLRVEGGHPLNGDYRPSGNANAAIYLLAASMLTGNPVTLRNMPDTLTIRTILEIAQQLGAQPIHTVDHSLTIQTEQITRRTLKQSDTAESLGALLFLAPILVRRDYVRVELDFPLNRVRTHLDAMRDLGFDIVSQEGAFECRSVQWDYKDIILSQTSVTATAIVMMLAACFGKETVVHNAASEPHLQQLAHFLEGMGAQIHGVSSNVLRIFGATATLHGTTFTIGPDHIETASIAALGALSGGRVHLVETRQPDLRMIAKVYERLGLRLDVDEHDVFVPRHDTLTLSDRGEDVDLSIETSPWPGFPSDLVAMATIIATQARGTALIHEKLYANRLLFVDKLKAMGAQIVLCDPHRAIVVGPTPLQAIYMDTPDVRTGLGMLSAALLAHGESVIDNAEALKRNFDGVVGKLQALGAKVSYEQ
ncbi:MAG: UDP-N-acetylglucosamine 1-carboxyvinyltransferase [Anaerolineae bacterium]